MTKQHFVILGAGISGLALAWYLKKRYQDQIRLTVIEKGSRAGGWICTTQQQGFLFEEGPRSCRTKGAGIATLELIEELGLQGEVIAASPDATKRYLYADKQLQCLPQSFLSLLFSPVMRGTLLSLFNEWRKTPEKYVDESIYDFFARRLSPKIAEQFIDPLVAGIYAGDIRQLSVRSCFSQLYQWEQTYGSLTKGMLFDRTSSKSTHSPFVQAMKSSPIFSFKKGMETLVARLSSKLHEHLQFNSSATTLKVLSGEIEVFLADGKNLRADRVFIALPAEATISLLKHSFPSMQTSLPEVSTASVAVVNLGWSQSVLKYSGFGYLIPSREQEKILGVVWDSSVFPQQNSSNSQTRLTV
ncbi:MAG: protoporphyrinogen oxidase, partial [Parachlamydiaceae bacterium]|nr:protoporphyrinogen oxidase [Parachlamydiaceae bacterium]